MKIALLLITLVTIMQLMYGVEPERESPLPESVKKYNEDRYRELQKTTYLWADSSGVVKVTGDTSGLRKVKGTFVTAIK